MGLLTCTDLPSLVALIQYPHFTASHRKPSMVTLVLIASGYFSVLNAETVAVLRRVAGSAFAESAEAMGVRPEYCIFSIGSSSSIDGSSPVAAMTPGKHRRRVRKTKVSLWYAVVLQGTILSLSGNCI